MNLCYEFHDGHLSAYFLDDDLRSRVNDNMYGNDYGFSMIGTDSGVTVAILTAGDSDAYALGIHDGTVITGWDGMNFTHMPELDSPYAYPIVGVVCVTIVVTCLIILKKKKWF